MAAKDSQEDLLVYAERMVVASAAIVAVSFKVHLVSVSSMAGELDAQWSAATASPLSSHPYVLSMTLRECVCMQTAI